MEMGGQKWELSHRTTHQLQTPVEEKYLAFPVGRSLLYYSTGGGISLCLGQAQPMRNCHHHELSLSSIGH